MLHCDPQQVSSSALLILRRTNCITTASGIVVVMKSGNLNFMEPSGPLQACNGTALPLPGIVTLCKQPYNMHVESGRYQRL